MTTTHDYAFLATMMDEIVEGRLATIYDDDLRAAAAALREAGKMREALAKVSMVLELAHVAQGLDPLTSPTVIEARAALGDAQ